MYSKCKIHVNTLHEEAIMSDVELTWLKIIAITNEIANIIWEPLTPQSAKALKWQILWLRAFAYELSIAYCQEPIRSDAVLLNDCYTKD